MEQNRLTTLKCDRSWGGAGGDGVSDVLGTRREQGTFKRKAFSKFGNKSDEF